MIIPLSGSMKLLGVRIDPVNKSEARARVSDFLSAGGQHTIFTPNPEMLVAAQRDHYFQDILNESSLNICDGFGLKLISIIKKNYIKLDKISGLDFLPDICELAEERGRGLYLLGAGDGAVIRAAAENLKRLFPKLKIAGYHRGPELRIVNGELRYNEETNDEILDQIIMASPDILFVGFGHEKQEKWIYEHLPQLPSVKVAMGVGGAFDVLGGKLKRAPPWMQKTGLEWLWRLLLEPKRIKRIWTAVVVFPYLCLLENKRQRR